MMTELTAEQLQDLSGKILAYVGRSEYQGNYAKNVVVDHSPEKEDDAMYKLIDESLTGNTVLSSGTVEDIYGNIIGYILTVQVSKNEFKYIELSCGEFISDRSVCVYSMTYDDIKDLEPAGEWE